jgi:hypothetical protein
MAELQQPAINPELYERLIYRLGLALDVAKTSVRLRDEIPVELELRGLSPAEFAVIEAYLGAAAVGVKAESVARSSSAARELDGPTAAPQRSAKVIWLNNQQRAKASAKVKSLYSR